MVKTKTPFFSLDSRGTVGGSLTSQKSGAATILRAKPVPTDPQTLPQQYQRWLYQDYAYLWTQQSAATQAEYRTAGTRSHLTGFQQWMKVQLSTLPDMLAWYRLDEHTGAVAHDSSPNPQNGVIIGATPTSGLINGAYKTDGVNDRINCGAPAKYDLNYPFTIEFLCTLHKVTIAADWDDILGKTATTAWHITQVPGGLNVSFYFDIGGVVNSNSFGALVLDSPTHLGVLYDGAKLQLWKAGVLHQQRIVAGDLLSVPTWPLLIGCGSLLTRYANVTIDNFIIYNRFLDQTEIQRHSLRRYPPQ